MADDRLRLQLNLRRLEALVSRMERAQRGMGAAPGGRHNAFQGGVRSSAGVQDDYRQRNMAAFRSAEAERQERLKKAPQSKEKGMLSSILTKAHTRLIVGVWLAATSEEIIKKIGRRLLETMRGQKDWDEAVGMIVWSLVPEILREGIPIIQNLVNEGIRKENAAREQERLYERNTADFYARLKDTPQVRQEAAREAERAARFRHRREKAQEQR